MILGGPDRSLPKDASQLAKKFRPIFHDLLMFFATTYREEFGFEDGPPLHDPVAMAVIMPESNTVFKDSKDERWNVEVVTDGQHSTDRFKSGQLGRTIVSKAEGEGIRIPQGLDVKRFWKLVQDALLVAEDSLLKRT